MTKTASEAKPQMRTPRAGMAIEEAPIVTEAARAELLASLERGEDDVKAERVKRMTFAELKADMRADFERITGHKIS
jgi:hypothetical protein